MTPAEVETGGVVVGWLATIIASFVTAWRVRGRRERQLSGDNASRKKKEWGDLGERVQKHDWKLDLLMKDGQHFLTDLNGLREDFNRHVIAEGAAFTRLEERFAAHVVRWEEVGVRAAKDRDEMLQKLDRLNDKLDQR